jgi:hypothetical protein
MRDNRWESPAIDLLLRDVDVPLAEAARLVR